MKTNTEYGFVRSPLFYVGDKFKLLPQITRLFPQKFKRMVEPFVGGGSVFLNVKTEQALVNDNNTNVIAIHELLLDNKDCISEFVKELIVLAREYNLSCSYEGDLIPKETQIRFPKTYFAEVNREGYARLKNHYNNSVIKKPLELYLLMLFGFNRMLRFNKKGQFNIPVGNVDLNSNVVDALFAYSHKTGGRNIVLKNLDFEAFLDSVQFETDDFLYVDPPYLIAATEYNKDWDEVCEKRLYSILDQLSESGVRFALSNAEKYNQKTNLVLSNWMKKYNVEEIKSNYINYFNNSEKKLREVLVRNYD